MKPELVFTNATIVTRTDAFRGSLKVGGAEIREIDTRGVRRAEAVDLNGDYLLPGFVELHTDCLEKHLMPRPSVRWPSLSALVSHDAGLVAAGITTAFDGISLGDLDGTDPVRNKEGPAIVAVIADAQANGTLRAEHRVHLRCELGSSVLMKLFGELKAHALVGLVSVMDHTPGQRQWHDLAKYREFNMRKKGWTEEQVERVIQAGRELSARYVTPHRQAVTSYCRAEGIPLASHDDTLADDVVQAEREGIRIAEFPTSYEAAEKARTLGLATVMGAPNVVRGGSHSGNVGAADLARSGLLDILSSDYVASSLAMGAFRLVSEGLMDMPRAIATISLHPARAVGLLDRGEIAPGLRADLVQVRLQGQVPVVRGVWRAGERVY